MSRLVFGKQVRVEDRKQDRYDRTIGRVLVALDECKQAECPKTLDVTMAQLTQGLAWHYKRFETEQPEQERGEYSFAVDEARAKREGRRQGASPVPPCEWRNSSARAGDGSAGNADAFKQWRGSVFLPPYLEKNK